MSVGYVVETKALKDAGARLGNYDKLSEKHLLSAMSKAVTAIEGEVRPLTPVGVSGRLRQSIVSSTHKEFGGVIAGRVGSSLKEVYPAVMEYGRKPGAKMPPPKALERWVHIVLRVPNRLAPGVAYVVARNIARRGIKGRFFLKKGFRKARKRVTAFFGDAMKLVIRDLKK